MLILLALAGALVAPDSTHCVAADRFLRETQRLVTSVDADTLDDWRTGQRQVGCRITAAGATDVGVAREAARLYERLRSAGWTRTPDPRDAPNEASLRFRWRGSDCLFNVYEGARLFTDAEFRVNDAVVPTAREVRYQVLALCMPALPAAP